MDNEYIVLTGAALSKQLVYELLVLVGEGRKYNRIKFACHRQKGRELQQGVHVPAYQAKALRHNKQLPCCKGDVN